MKTTNCCGSVGKSKFSHSISFIIFELSFIYTSTRVSNYAKSRHFAVLVFALIYSPPPHTCAFTMHESVFVVCAHIHTTIRPSCFAIYNLVVFKIAFFNYIITPIFFAFYKHIIHKFSICRSISHCTCWCEIPHSVSFAICKLTAVSNSVAPVYVNSVAMEIIILKFTFVIIS